MQAYIANQNFDIVCLSETFLNSSIQNDDNKLKIDGYNLIRSDHLATQNKKAKFLFIKKNILLLLGVRDDHCTIDNCLVTEIRLQKEKFFLTCA